MHCICRYRVHQVQQDIWGIAGYGGDEWALYAWTAETIEGETEIPFLFVVASGDTEYTSFSIQWLPCHREFLGKALTLSKNLPAKSVKHYSLLRLLLEFLFVYIVNWCLLWLVKLKVKLRLGRVGNAIVFKTFCLNSYLWFWSELIPLHSGQVVVANSKRDGSTRDPREDEKLVRLFVICPKTYSEKDLRDEFEVRIRWCECNVQTKLWTAY